MASIKNRGPGKWHITISLGYHPDGRKHLKTFTFHTDTTRTEKAQRKAVEAFAAQTEADLKRGMLSDAHKVAVDALAQEWLADGSKRLSPTTVAGYRHLLNTRILPALGNKNVSDLSPRQIQRFLDKLSTEKPITRRGKEETISGNAQLHYFRCLSALLGYARRMGYIVKNPCENVTPPRKAVAETKVLQPEEAIALLEALNDEPVMWRCFFTVALFSQCRPGELIALNWTDVNEDGITIRASAARVEGGGSQRTDRPKTSKSVRTVVLPQSVMQLLDEWHTEQTARAALLGDGWQGEGNVFCGDLGRRLDVSSPTQRFQKFLDKHPDLPRVPLYSLRHTGASLLISQGISATDIAHRLGHSSTAVTLSTYVHQFAAADRKAADALTAALSDEK